MLRPILIIVMLLVSANQLSARTWYINTGGTGDAPTIAAAIDSSMAGDMIELECGTYTETWLQMKSGVTLCSSTGYPECVTIDANSPSLPHRPVITCWHVGDDTLIQGLTITGGRATDSMYGGISGGGLNIHGAAGPRVERCLITGNYAKVAGGVSVSQCQPTFIDCEITGNESFVMPAGIRVTGGVFTAFRTSIIGNTGYDGRVASDSAANFYCCDFAPGNWDFEGSHLINDADCDFVSTETQSWGSVKALYR